MKNSRVITAILAIAISAIYVGCSNTEAKKGVGINLANFDSTISPVQDFFHYANGGWIKEDGSWDFEKIELACHYIKASAASSAFTCATPLVTPR